MKSRLSSRLYSYLAVVLGWQDHGSSKLRRTKAWSGVKTTGSGSLQKKSSVALRIEFVRMFVSASIEPAADTSPSAFCFANGSYLVFQ